MREIGREREREREKGRKRERERERERERAKALVTVGCVPKAKFKIVPFVSSVKCPKMILTFRKE